MANFGLATLDWLRILTFVAFVAPLFGSLIIAILGKWNRAVPRMISLGAVVISFASASALLGMYRAVAEAKRVDARRPMAPTILQEIPLLSIEENKEGFVVKCLWGLDGISAVLLWLTSLLALSSVLISLKTVKDRAEEYYVLLLWMTGASMLVFVAFDIVFFYIFFEFTLVPMFFLIGIWGGPDRRHAARKFFIYTLAGSLIGLVALIAYAVQLQDLYREAQRTVGVQGGREYATGTQTTSLGDMARRAAFLNRLEKGQEELRQKWERLQRWVFWALFLAFAIKVPLVPLHTWLPLAHVEAPTAGSVFLAGVLLKLGTYGFLRIVLPLLPNATVELGVPLIAVLAVIGIIYGSLCAGAQGDIKRLVAYSSIAHMGFCMLGMGSLNAVGLAGSVLEMVNHGLYTGGLFLLVGMIYERYHTRTIADLGGLAKRLPVWSFFMVGMSLASIALPGLNGFVSETLCLAGMFQRSPLFAVLGASGMVLGAWYMLSMLRQVVFGPWREPASYQDEREVEDLDLAEWLAIALPLALCLALGVYPKAFLDLIRPDLEGIASLFSTLR